MCIRDRNKTQKEMADMLECTMQHYQRIEYGKVNLPATTLLFLADYFGVTTDYLLGRTDRPDQNTDGTTYFPRHPCVGFQGRT